MRTLSRLLPLLILILLGNLVQNAHAQHFFGVHGGYNKSSPPVANYSLGLRYDWQKNQKHTFGFSFQWLMPQNRASSTLLLSRNHFEYPDTRVATNILQRGLQLQFQHKINFVVKEKVGLYAFYGPGADLFFYDEYAAYYDQSLYFPPFQGDGDSFSNTISETAIGISAHAGIGFDQTLKSGRHWFFELDASLSLISLPLDIYEENLVGIPHFISLKTGFRFETAFGKPKS